MLTETRSVALPPELLSTHTLIQISASQPSRAGEGMLIAVRKCVTLSTQKWASDASSLWVKLTSIHFPRPLFLGCCYLPPAGSAKLIDTPLPARFSALQNHITTASVLGDVLLAGDFNARVGVHPAPRALRSSSLTPISPAPRGCTDYQVNLHGRSLLDLCASTTSTLLTGCVLGDLHATPTFRARSGTQPSRLDHALVSRSFLPLVVSSTINPSRLDSDHYPLEICLSLPHVPGQPPVISGTPLPSRHWRHAFRDPYACALLSSPLLSSLAAPIPDPAHLTAAFSTLDTLVLAACTSAGMPPHGAPRTTRPSAPFYDRECVSSKRRYRAALRRGDPETEIRALERLYHSLVRSKRRAYQLERLHQLVEEQRNDPRQFWKRLRHATTALPLSLMGTQAWGPYLHDLCHLHPLFPPILLEAAYPSQPHAVCSPLNAPLDIDEATSGLSRLHNGRSSATTGVLAELYRYAQLTPTPDNPSPSHLLAPLLLHLLNSAFMLGSVPAPANLAPVTPIYKKGDNADTSNYRPIAVSEPILRLYASILNARIISLTEDCTLRAPSQAGFRPALSTLHPLFALQHFVDESSRTSTPLYCCFLDLKSAYDSVHRPLLWEVLSRLGFHGRMLAAIKSLYATSSLAIKVGGRVGASIPSLTGVKQGCPLSPTLFGIFLDGLHRYIAVHCPHIGPTLADGTSVSNLQYADDVTLLACDPTHLQILIDCAVAFCKSVGLRLSPAKTSIISFPSTSPSIPWLCDQLPIQRLPSATYLGLTFHAKHGVSSSCAYRAHKMYGAWATLQRQYAGLNCGVSLGLLMRVYHACIPPVASYGCELWGLRTMPRRLAKARHNLAVGHVNILRQITGLRKSTPHGIVFLESGGTPLYHSWLLRTVTFWNNLSALPPASLFRRVAFDSISRAYHGATNWASSFAKALEDIDYPFVLSVGEMDPVDPHLVRHLLAQQQSKFFVPTDDNPDPRTCPSQGVIVCTYARWFQQPTWARNRIPPVRLSLPPKSLRLFLRFRSGCSGLPVDTGRRRRPTPIPRAQRFCLKCDMQSVCDEYHMVFECSALAPLREQFSALFTPATQSMLSFMWQENMCAVAAFVVQCSRFLEVADS
jgi:hypothetical protein